MTMNSPCALSDQTVMADRTEIAQNRSTLPSDPIEACFRGWSFIWACVS